MVCPSSTDEYWHCERSRGEEDKIGLLKITWQNETVKQKGKIEKMKKENKRDKE